MCTHPSSCFPRPKAAVTLVAAVTLLTALGACNRRRASSDRKKDPPSGLHPRPTAERPTKGVGAIRPLYKLVGHELGVEGLAFCRDSRCILSGGEDKTVRLWDLATGKTRRAFTGHEQWVSAVTFNPEDDLVATASADKTLRICRVNRKTSPRIIKEHGGVRSLAFSLDGKLLASGAFGGDIRIWHVASGDWRMTLRGHSSDVYSMAWSRDGKTLASGGADQKIILWSTSTGKPLRTLSGHTGSVRLVTISTDGATLLSVAEDRTVRTWDVPTGQQRTSVTISAGQVRAAALSPDGRILLVAVDRRALLVDPTSGKILRSFPAASKPLFAVAISPDGQSFAWSGADPVISVWSTRPM